MIGKCTIIAMVVVTAINQSCAIQCDFKYVEHNSLQNSTQAISNSQSKSFNGSVPVRSGYPKFKCEDPNDDFEVITGVKPMEFDSRFGDDEYEPADEEDCPSNKKTIQPKALNNIYNELLDVVNTATVIQSIEVDECGTKNAACNNGIVPSSGKFTLCRQEYVKITLKAFKGKNHERRQIVDEPFYYPSHCICQLVQKKKST